MNFKDNISHHSIVRIPCPHCSHLCSSIAKSCPKCGEPLKSIKNTASVEKNLELIEEKESEINHIRHLELKLKRHIPQVKKLKRDVIGYEKESEVITGLSLFKCELREIPQEVFKLKFLDKLYLRRNSIEEIPISIDSLKNLKGMDLSINSLKKIPNSIGLLSNLKKLNLSSNLLEIVPETLNRLQNLQLLYLNNNRLKEIPIKLKNLLLLKKVDIRGNLLLTNKIILRKTKKKSQSPKKQMSLDKFLH